jgi:hypothetical protein
MQTLPARADYVELPTMCGRFTQAYTRQEIRDLYDPRDTPYPGVACPKSLTAYRKTELIDGKIICSDTIFYL